jgi:hypothetical protein
MVLGLKAWESRPLPGLQRAEIPLRDLFLDGGGLRPSEGRRLSIGAGWSSPVARQAHNLKVVGSNPTPATKLSH